jgi:lycopene cyclase domain-containing protein
MTLTYLEFLAGFVAVPLLVLGLATRRRRVPSHVRPLAVMTVVGLALAWTIPWDNYLIGVGVWEYGPGRVWRVLWRAPVEEYLFIAAQPVLAACWLHLVSGPVHDEPGMTWRQRGGGALAGLLVTALGLVATTRGATFYLGAIIAWAGPVLALQWAVGWRYLLARGRTIVVGVGVPTAYLSVADAIALHLGIWRLEPAYTTGLAIGGLPVEEALFFLVTTLLVCQGLLLYPWVIARWQ